MRNIATIMALMVFAVPLASAGSAMALYCEEGMECYDDSGDVHITSVDADIGHDASQGEISIPEPEPYIDEDRNEPIPAAITTEEAMDIAGDSECVQEGRLLEKYSYNGYTGTYWIEMESDKPGCNPACVVDVQTLEAEVNWRCTGVIEPIPEGAGYPPSGDVNENGEWDTPHGGDPDMVIGIGQEASKTVTVQPTGPVESLFGLIRSFFSLFFGAG